MEKQPAHKSYVFDKGYRDIADAFKKTWSSTFLPVKSEGSKLAALLKRGNVILALITLICDLPIFAVIISFRVLLNSVISIFLAAIFLVCVPVVFTGFTLVWFLDFIFRAFKRISSRCPSCQAKFDIPAYRCPGCGAIHTRLLPSQYGIFMRKCNCGKKIPTTFFNGRQKLQAFCRNCNSEILDGGKHRDICFPVIGGPNAGKTCFINMAISELSRVAKSKYNMDFGFVMTAHNDYTDIMEDMRHRQLPSKTYNMRLMYYQFYLTPAKKKMKHLVSLCDVGGEVFKGANYSGNASLGGQIGLKNADGFIVVVDPLSVDEYKKEVEKKYNISGFAASEMAIDEILSRLLTAVESMYHMSARTAAKKDVAVLFTKCDIPGLDEIIGAKAVMRYMNSNKVSERDAVNALCESFLRKYNEDNFVNTLKSKFGKIQFFTCSSLGYNKNSSSFEPDGVVEPVMWMYKRICG